MCFFTRSPLQQRWELDQRELAGPLFAQLDEAVEEISHHCAARSIDEEQWIAGLAAIATDEINEIIIRACLKYRVTPDDLYATIAQNELAY